MVINAIFSIRVAFGLLRSVLLGMVFSISWLFLHLFVSIFAIGMTVLGLMVEG